MTTIVERKTVREAVARALLERPGDTDAALAAVAQRLGLDAETVRECVREGEAC